MLAVMQMSVQQVVPMVNLTVVMDLVSMAHGHVTAMVTVLMAQMKPTVNLKAVPMVNLTVAMDLASMAHGHVTAMVTALMAQMKPIVVVKAVPMVNLTVVPKVAHMVSVSMAHGHVMERLTVMMAQMKPTVVAVLQSAKIVNMIGHLMEPNAVIALGMRLVLTALPLKAIMVGIAPVVTVLVIAVNRRPVKN